MKNKLNLLLLNLDAADGGIADPLAMPAGSVDTSMPLLAPDKLYNMTTAKVENKVNDAGVGMLRITLKTTKEELDNQGQPVNAGFPVFVNFVYTPTGKLDVSNILRTGAQMLKAYGLPQTSVRDLVTNPEMLVDKVVCVKIRTRKEKDGYPATSEVGSWVELKG